MVLTLWDRWRATRLETSTGPALEEDSTATGPSSRFRTLVAVGLLPPFTTLRWTLETHSKNKGSQSTARAICTASRKTSGKTNWELFTTAPQRFDTGIKQFS